MKTKLIVIFILIIFIISICLFLINYETFTHSTIESSFSNCQSTNKFSQGKNALNHELLISNNSYHTINGIITSLFTDDIETEFIIKDIQSDTLAYRREYRFNITNNSNVILLYNNSKLDISNFKIGDKISVDYKHSNIYVCSSTNRKYFENYSFRWIF